MAPRTAVISDVIVKGFCTSQRNGLRRTRASIGMRCGEEQRMPWDEYRWRPDPADPASLISITQGRPLRRRKLDRFVEDRRRRLRPVMIRAPRSGWRPKIVFDQQMRSAVALRAAAAPVARASGAGP
jgi:hypothetical protein